MGMQLQTAGSQRQNTGSPVAAGTPESAAPRHSSNWLARCQRCGRQDRGHRPLAARSPILPATLLLLVSLSLGAQDLLQFQHVVGDRFRIVTTVSENVFVNGNYSHHAEILNRVAVEVVQARNGSGLVQGVYQVVERGADEASAAYGPLANEYYSSFWRDPTGLMEVEDQALVPSVRHIPRFPTYPVSPGDTWSFPGEEVHDFRENFGVEEPFRFPVNVHYSYLGRQSIDGRQLGAIKIQYTIFHRVPMALGLGRNPPDRITGISEQLLYWDFDLGLPVLYEDEFTFVLHLISGDVVEFQGHAEGELIISEPLDRQQMAKDIARKLEEEGLDDATVAVSEAGVTISLENIQFPPDSPQLVPSEQRKLDQIASILAEFPDRDLLITGHTARVGSEQTSQVLSELRAQAVGTYLISIGARTPQQLVFQGFGSQRPVARNDIEEGRRRNRRVEITILEN